ncbi:MAG: MBL fold metallo-hydrolase [Phycisphaerae bacterium]|nr:MBL fold metallo-hydrolase [Phycisphaerae bacterium]
MSLNRRRPNTVVASVVALLAPFCLLLCLVASAAPAHAQCGVGDITEDGAVDSADLAVLLGAWATSGTSADLNGDDTVDATDLAMLLANWGTIDVEVGTFPDVWIWGAPNCATDPTIQVHRYNEDTFILRQSICTNFEGPFIYLLFGSEKVLMEDTGASNVPMYNTVKAIIDQWLIDRGQASIQLIVSHSHAHGDHVFNDGQFVGKPNTTVVGTSQTAVKNFFGIVNWPTDIVDYDLGGRVVQVLPIPGHHSAHIAFYDQQTGFLLTGDTLYPGRLYISNWTQFKASIQRMVDFTADKTLCHVMGTHIEMSQIPGDDYPIGAPSHPNEHELELAREHLIELNDACIAMGASPVYQVHDDFIIFPLSFSEPPANNSGVHGGDEPCCERPKTVFDYRRLRGLPRR